MLIARPSFTEVRDSFRPRGFLIFESEMQELASVLFLGLLPLSLWQLGFYSALVYLHVLNLFEDDMFHTFAF